MAVSTQREGPVSVIWLDRPEKLNAFDRAQYAAVNRAIADFETDPERLSTMAGVYNSDGLDLTAFRDAGGKMIVWHGWADAGVTPYKTVEWYEKLAQKYGGMQKVREFARLFMIPGMGHCGGFPGVGGIDQFSIDPLGALESWVETGRAPDTIMK